MEPILFTSDAPWNSRKGDWLGIRVNGNLRLKNAVVEYATYGIKFVGNEDTDEIYIQDCAIRHNSGHGIDIYVDNNTNISAFIDSNIISDNDGNGISCRAYTGSTTLNLNISGNTVSDNGETGIYCFADGGSGDPAIIGTICNNTVFGHTTHEIYSYTYQGARSELTIDNNTVHHSGIGIYTYYNRASSTSTLDVTNNTAHTGTEGIKIYTYDSSISPLILNNAVYEHVANGITCSYGGADTYNMVPRIEGNQVFDNFGNGIYLKATEQVTVFNNGLYNNYSFDLYNDSAFDINARSNWWGVNTTNQINSGINPRNISTIFDSFDDSSRGTVDYADWLSLYETPNPPTLDFVESPTQGETIAFLPIPTEGLVARYPFNGNANDESENANDGIVNGAILTEDRFGNYNSAYRFDGVDDYIGEYATDVFDDFTISLWVYPEEPHQLDVQSTYGTGGTSGQNYVISPVHYGDSGDAGAGISVGTNGVSIYEHASSYMPAPLVWQGTLDNWTHIILVYQNKKPSLFVNGSFVKSGYISPKNHVYGNNSSTGGYQYGYFKGYIDDVSIYNRALSESEIQQLFNENIQPVVQTLSGTKDAGASIILNGTEVVPADEETTWLYEMPLYEGTNPITLYSRTTAGMASGVVISSISLDTTAPHIYSSVPADGAFVSRVLESVDITLIEESTEIDAQATLSLAMLKDYNETQVPGQWSIDYNHVVFLPDQPIGVGTYTATLHPTDTPLGNSRTSSIMFTVDLTAPAVPTLNEILSPTRITPQTISGGKDTGASIWLDNSRIVPGDDLADWSYNLSLLEGENTHKLYARDEAGNRSDEIIFTTILDRAPPVLQNTEPANGAFVNESPSMVAFFFTDLTTSLSEEPTLATASMHDSSNQEIPGNWELQVPNTVVFTPVSPLDEDTYTVSVQAHDLAGNTTSSTISFTYDGTPPSPPTLEAVQSPTIFAVQTLSGTKEANSSVWLNGTEVVAINADTAWSYQITLIEGENPLEFYSKDAASNQSNSVFAAIIYDETAPLPVANLMADGSGIGTSVTLDWTGYDEQIQGDIAYYRVYAENHLFTQVAELEPINSVPAGTFTYTANNLVKGTLYYFAVVAVDTKGNALSSVTPVSAVPGDTVAPEDVTNLQVQCFDTGLTFTWNQSANTYGDLAGYKAYFNNSTEVVLLTSSQTTHEQTGLTSATEYPFKVSSYDTDGNESNGISITGVTLLANPANVSVTPYSGYVDITWDGVVPSQLVKHYSVYVSETDFSTVQGMAPKLTATGTSAKIAGLTNNKTYYFAVTSVNLSGGETKVVSAVSETPVPDTQGPEISDVKVDDTAFLDGAVLNSSGTFTLNVTDPASLSRVEFYIDGVLYYTDSNGSNHYSCFLNITSIEDGSHALIITAYDTLGNSTSITYNLIIALDPPAAPTITTPSSGTLTNNSIITVSGSGEKDTEIILYNNVAEAGAPTPVDANGSFSISLILTEGENRIKAAARNRAGTGPQSVEVLITLDTNIPQSPTHLSAEAKASGLIRLAWQKPLEASAKGYHLYRAATSFNSREEATQINSNLITGISFDDLTPEDETWYYRVSIVDTADNESELSDEAFAQSDSTLPRAVSIQYTPTGQYDEATGRTAPGLIDVLLTVSEPLQTTPFLSITPESGVPISVELTKSADLEYTGFFVISDTTPTGTAYAVFSGRDMVGNRGTEINFGGSIKIDTNGPAVIEIAIQPADPVRNDQTNPVFVTAFIGLNEVMKPDETPQLSYLLSAEGRSAIAIESLILISAQPGHAQTWQGTFQLPDDAGLAEVETLEFIYGGIDDLNNVSADILCANHFQIYQGDLPPFAPPQNLTGQSLPGGRISLSWNEVEGAVGYQLYRQSPDEVELTAYERLETVLEFMDELSSDGLYIYAIASIRQDNEQESVSGMSSSVEVVSDSVCPGTPQSLTLNLMGQGIKAEWEAPSYTEAVTYSLYRADLTEITSVEGLEPVVTGITETTAVDPQPSHTEHCYVVTAVDNAGNESAPSNSFYLNFALLPVPSLKVLQSDDDSPIVSWTQPGGSIAGYDIYLGPEDQMLKLNETLLTDLSYTDTGYTGDERRYTVVAGDENGEESLGRSITLPQVCATLLDGELLKRGIMNRLEYSVESLSADTVDDIHLKVNVNGKEHISESFSLQPLTSNFIPVIVGGYADLPDLAFFTTTIEVTPNTGEKVEIVRTTEIEVGDGMLIIGILNEEFIRGGAGSVRFTLENTGEEEIEIVTATGSGSSPSNEITFYLLDPDGNVLSSTPFKQNLGEGIITLANGNTVARILPERVFTSEPLEIPVPISSPDEVIIQLEISQIHYHQGKPDQVSMAGVSTTRQISLVDTSYYGEVISITPESSSGNEDILITGQAVERDTCLPMPNVPLNLMISVNGFERKYNLFTEADGSFSYTFTPLSGESGLYKVWAVHPDLLDKPVQGEFVINRLSISPSMINLNIPKNYEQEINIQVAAGEGTIVNDLMLVYDELDQPTGAFPEGVHVTIGDSIAVLGSGETGFLGVTLWADNNAEEIGRLVFKVKSDETGNDSWGSVIINTHFSDAQPVLYFTPDHVETGLAFDETVNETIILENRGLADLTDVSLAIVSEDGTPAPDWVHLNAASDQGVISIGETREVGIAFSPTTGGVTEGMYLFYLRVASSNYRTTDIGIYVSVTQSGVGSALFKVADIYTGTVDQNNEIIQGLAGAKIKVQNEEVLTIEQTQTTDSLGEVLFSDLPAGRYKCRITADNHQEYIGRLWIKPGITVSKEVFLSYNLVTVEWEVTETTIEDKYEISINVTYETDVPAAVVVAEPASINLPRMEAGDVYYGEFSLTNYGLIRAEEVQFELPPSDQIYEYELLSGLPDTIEAKERITVPYRVTRLKAAQESGGNGGECWTIRKCFSITYVFECAYFENGQQIGMSYIDTDRPSWTAEYCIIHREGDCQTSISMDDLIKEITKYYQFWDRIGRIYSPIVLSLIPEIPAKIIDGLICWPKPIRKELISTEIISKDTRMDWKQIVGCSVNCALREYNDEATDLSVKVPGGSISIRRLYYGKQWHWDHERNNLTFVKNLDYVKSVEKGGVIYERSSDFVSFPVFVHEKMYRIRQIEGGYRWEDNLGNWKEYDLTGQITSYGNRTGVLGTLLFDETEDSALVGMTDSNDIQVLWFEYNTEGNLSAIHDSDNRRVEYEYAGKNLTTVIDVLGNETVYEYNSNGWINRSMDAAGRLTFVAYDSYGNVSQVTDKDGNGHFFEFNYDGVKNEYYSRIQSSSGKVKEIWYDSNVDTRQVSINDRVVKKIVKDGDDLTIIDEKGNVTRKEYDEWDNLTNIVHPDESTVTFEYEHNFNKPVRITDQKGNITEYEYDEKGNLTKKIEAVGTDAECVTTFTYDEYSQLFTATIEADANTKAATTTFTYDDNSNLASITDPEGNRTEFLLYNNMGKLLEMKDPRGYLWTYTYDGMGRLTFHTDPLENITAYEYDGANNRTAVINAYLKKFDFEYDDHNNMIKAIDPYEKYTINKYNTDDLVTQTIDKEGKKTLFEYDNKGRLVKAVDGVDGADNKNKTVYEYDESLETSVSSYKPVRIIFPTYMRRIYYDNLQRVIRETDILDENTSHSTSYVYDAGGNLTSETDADGNITRYEYDALNRLTKITDSMGGIAERSFDDRGNLIALKDPNNGITQYEYDRNNRLVKMIRPMGEGTVYEYDAAGNRITVFDAKGQKISYEYDALNRLIRTRHFAAGDHDNPVKTVEFTYNKLGSLEIYNDGTTSAVYTYNDLQQKTGESINYGPFTLSYSYSYYANGMKKSFTNPNGITLGYTYDSNNRLSGVTIPGHDQITYNTYYWNSPAKITWPGGTTEEYGYDPLMQLKSITARNRAQNNFMIYNYEYSPAGNITAKNTEHGNYAYQYDELYRLTEATNPNASNEAYTYDGMGNRLTAAGVTGTWNYNDNNELLGYADVSFEYDNNGNITKKTVGNQIVNYVYDVTDRLILVEDGAESVVAEYYYDPFGRRLWKEVGGARTCYLYADEGLVGEYDSSGSEIRTYGYAPDSVWTTNPLFQKVGGNYYWYQNDHLGTPQKLIDMTSDRVVWAGTYDAFGNIQLSVTEVENNFRFSGQYYDTETGLYYNWNRYYDPVVGRYMRPDPFDQEINTYVYTFANPINLSDPRGLCVLEKFVQIGTTRIIKESIKVGVRKLGETAWMKGLTSIGTSLVRFSVYIPLAYDTLSTFKRNAFRDDRNWTENWARISIDMVATSVIGISTFASGGGAATIGVLYSVEREQIQEDILNNPVTGFMGTVLYETFWPKPANSY